MLSLPPNLELALPPTAGEVAWSTFIAEQMGGQAEVRLMDKSRCDILTDTHAIEVEWIKKATQAPGQALLYAALTGRKPGVILLSRGKPREEIYFLRSGIMCAHAGIDMAVVKTLGG